jgi:hypothetical protein
VSGPGGWRVVPNPPRRPAWPLLVLLGLIVGLMLSAGDRDEPEPCPTSAAAAADCRR